MCAPKSLWVGAAIYILKKRVASPSCCHSSRAARWLCWCAAGPSPLRRAGFLELFDALAGSLEGVLPFEGAPTDDEHVPRAVQLADGTWRIRFEDSEHEH